MWGTKLISSKGDLLGAILGYESAPIDQVCTDIYICINHLLDISITCVCKEGQGQGHTLSDCKLFIHTLSENGFLNKVQMEKGCIYRSEWLSEEEVCTCSSGC